MNHKVTPPDVSIPEFVLSGRTLRADFNDRPLFSLTINQIENIFKLWIWETFNPDTIEKKQPEYITRKDAALILNISLPTLDKFIKNGVLKAKREGHRILIRDVDLQSSMTTIMQTKHKHY